MCPKAHLCYTISLAVEIKDLPLFTSSKQTLLRYYSSIAGSLLVAVSNAASVHLLGIQPEDYSNPTVKAMQAEMYEKYLFTLLFHFWSRGLSMASSLVGVPFGRVITEYFGEEAGAL